MKEKNITNEQLAELINNLRGEISAIKKSDATRAVFYHRIESEIRSLKEEIGGFRVELRDLRQVSDQLSDGAFSKDEKEDILGVIKHLNQQFEDDALGEEQRGIASRMWS